MKKSSDLDRPISRIFIDSAQLERTLLNLVLNARDAMPAGGELTIRAEDVEVEDPEGEPMVPTDWDLSFDEYLEEHKNSKLLFCWWGPRVGIVFSPADHHGIWAGQREGVKGKGTLPAYLQEVVERIAKEKGLA